MAWALVLLLGWPGSPAFAGEAVSEPDILELTRGMIELERQGDKRTAWEIGHGIVSSAEDTLGPDHPTLALYLDHLGTLGHELGEGDEAERLLLRALSIQQRVFGVDHIASQRTMRHLGAFYWARGQGDSPAEILGRVDRYRADHPMSPRPSP